jgi:ABC-type branched-subunit amino acid transport system substrate-binding protein
MFGQRKVTDRARVRRVICVVVVAAMLGAGCGNSSDSAPPAAAASSGSTSVSSGNVNEHVAISGVPGVTDSEIRFSSLGTNSNNPLGTCVLSCFDDGVRAYFDFRNSTGGIYGRKLVLSKEVDDELANNQAKALEIVSANDTFATFSATLLATGWGDLASNGIPTYVWMIDPGSMAGHPEIFGNREVVCVTCSTRPLAYAVKAAGKTHAATLGYSASESSKECADSTAKSIDKYSADLGGAHTVYTKDDLDFGLPNGLATEVTAMKQAGVDFIYGCLDLNGMKILAEELQRQGMRQSVTLLHANTYDQKFVQDAGDLFVGDLVQATFRPFEADPGGSELKDFHEWMAKAGKPETEVAMVGWINADLAYQGLAGAGPDFDRAKVIGATNQLTNFTAGGLTQPVDWSRQHEPATEDDPKTHGPREDCTVLVKVGPGGKFAPIGDPTKPWICFPGDTRDWSDPVAMNFN